MRTCRPNIPMRTLIAGLAAPLALSACGAGETAPQAPAPLSAAALAAVSADPGTGRESLARAIDELFADPAAGETRALVVMRGGRIAAERYGDGFGKDTRQLGWSASKCVTGILIGYLVSDGRLRLDQSAPVPAWQRSGDPRGEITLRQLLQMRSGLRHSEGAEPVYSSDEVRMLFLDGRDDMARHAEAQPLEAEPGRRFEYSSATSVILADLATRALSESADPDIRRGALGAYLRNRFLEPAGMHSARIEFDAAGTFIGSSMVHMTARDWARLGEFLRNKGSVRGAQLLPRSWIEFMTSPSPREAAYGAQIWLNRPSGDDDAARFPAPVPADAYACIGHLGQYVLVSPRHKLTIARLGHSSAEQRAAVRAHLARIVARFPNPQ